MDGRIPGIAGMAVVVVEPLRPVCDLVHVQLAEQNGARMSKPLHDGGIFARDVILKKLATRCRSNASCVDHVFQSDGNTVKRASGRTTLQFRFRDACLGKRRQVTGGAWRAYNRSLVG